MNGSEQEHINEIRRVLAHDSAAASSSEISRVVESHQLAIGSSAIAALTQRAHTEVSGTGPLQVYLDDPAVTDVLVNDYNDAWIDRGAGLERIPLNLGGPTQLRALAVRLASACGARLDDSSPQVDGRLPDGTRLHGLLHPVCESAATISLRTSRARALTLAELVETRTIPAAWHPLLAGIISARLNFLVSGATGTGKTTLLSTLLSLCDQRERIIIVEESREVRPNHPHVLSLETKRPNIEGRGELDQVALVRNTLRMRPDRVVVGECRGAEVRDMLIALNTGHEGGSGTIHANSAMDIPARLEALGALAGMSRPALAAQAASALDLVIHLRRTLDPSGFYRRFVSEIAVLHLDESGYLEAVPAFSWSGDGPPQSFPGARSILARLG